jgi:hypothetical protein
LASRACADRVRAPGVYAWGHVPQHPPAPHLRATRTKDEARDAALQYVRKISGSTKPSRANEEAFARAVEAVTAATTRLLDELVTTAPPKDREVEAAKARARSAQRYAA